MPGLQNLSPTAHYSYLAAWFVALAVVVGTSLLLRSRLGLVVSSIRDNEVAARNSGVNVRAARRTVFIIAAAGCGAAGAVLTISQSSNPPASSVSSGRPRCSSCR